MILTPPRSALQPVRASIALLALLALTLLLVPAQALGQSLEEIRAKALYNELRCVVCAGQSIAESNAELAQDMRAQVDRLILAGQSDAEIRSWFVERYGDAVLMTPPLNVLTLGLWFGPVLIFVLGLGMTLLVLRRGQARLGARGTDNPASGDDDQRGGR
jgi:cytochrome c-type biogenesis protein CcmH